MTKVVVVGKSVSVALAVAVAASMERTAAAMSHLAERMRERRRDVKDLDASFTCLIVASKSSGAGRGATVASENKVHELSNIISMQKLTK